MAFRSLANYVALQLNMNYKVLFVAFSVLALWTKSYDDINFVIAFNSDVLCQIVVVVKYMWFTCFVHS